MASSIDFLATVYNSLAKTLNAGGLGSSSVLQMAWPGYSLTPADFRAPEEPTGGYDIDVAREVFSELSNIAPTQNKAYFENSGFEIDDLYEILICSALPVVPPGTDPLANPLNKLFSDALFELTQTRRGYKHDPNRFYYPCAATPSNWYDEASVPSWSTINVKASEVKPAEVASAFVQHGGLRLAEKGVLRLKPAPAEVPSLKTMLLESVDVRGNLAKQTFSSLATGGPTKPLNTQIVAAAKLQPRTSGGVVARGPATVPQAAISRQNLAAVRMEAAINTKSVPTNTFLESDLRAAVMSAKLDSQSLLLEPDVRLPVRKKLILADLLAQKVPVKPMTPSTNGFTVTFKFCKVNIDRSWLKLALLASPNWRMFNTSAREYSTGMIDDNPGMFPLLPLAFVAIRDLRITADWSAEDRANLSNATSFGFFDLKGGGFQQNTYEVKGMQVIAWLSRVTPPMPPQG